MSSPPVSQPSTEAAGAPPPFTPEQRRLFLFLSVATLFEGFDFIALTQILPNLRAEMGLSPTAGGALVAFINIGTILAWVLVRQADRLGRRTVLMYTLVGYTLASLASGLAPNVWFFGAFQLIARVFLIAEWATSMVYASEAFPAQKRGLALGVIQGASSLGAVICAGLVPVLIKLPWGWRSVYFVGAIPLLLIIYARRNLPETERFKEAVHDGSRPFYAIFKTPFRKRLLLMSLLWALTYAGTQSAITFWKEFVTGERGWTDHQVGVALTIAAVVALPLVFSVGKLIDVVGRRRGAAIIFPVTALSIWGAFSLHNNTALTVCMAGVIFGVSAVLPVLNAWTTELFPTEWRADAFAWSNNLLGRTSMVGMPLLIGVLAETWGWGPAVRISALGPVLALVGIMALLPETSSKELEETAAI